MIARCREAGLAEPEFKLTDGFVAIIRRKAGVALEKVTGRASPEVTAQATAQAGPNTVRYILRKDDQSREAEAHYRQHER